ncbi:hypothetical protein SO802_026094 [Lithocarpus litseifolius]|uniref:Reverse transcriptase n=1 Tax=Lithocarpus litseifolius TaxID=425828 RepID=A0AAW2C1Y5_9ROSI
MQWCTSRVDASDAGALAILPHPCIPGEIFKGRPIKIYLKRINKRRSPSDLGGEDTRESLNDILGFASAPSLGKYLRIPIRHPRSSSHEYNFVLDRVKQKLAGWKASMLSFAGRAILIQAFSTAIPSYVMQCAKLPGRILDGIDRVTRTKEEGGLGLQAAKVRNTALLAKLNWRLHTEREALWALVLWKKYHNNRRLNASNPDRLPCSQVWTAIKRGRETFEKDRLMMISKDSNVSFWRGNWLSKGPLRNLIQRPLTQGATHLEVKDVLTDTGWDWSKIPFELPLDVNP